MIQPLIAKSEFVGLENITHLAAGGETPMLKSHRQAIDQFMIDKSRGEEARSLEADMVELAREKCSRLFSVKPEEITFLSNASEGINNLAYGLEWRSGDNVVVVDVEFPSGLLPWTRFENLGVEVRVARHKNWFVELEDIAARTWINGIDGVRAAITDEDHAVVSKRQRTCVGHLRIDFDRKPGW